MEEINSVNKISDSNTLEIDKNVAEEKGLMVQWIKRYNE